MKPFAIAGIQMHVLPERNIDGIRQRLKLLMHYYPWVEMVLLQRAGAVRLVPALRASAARAGGRRVPADGARIRHLVRAGLAL